MNTPLRRAFFFTLLFVLCSLQLTAQNAPDDIYWDSRFLSPPRFDGVVHAIAVAGDNIYVGGRFGMIEGIRANNIARWNRTDRTWSALDSGTSGPVHSLAVHGDSLYVGGNFMLVDGDSANYVAAYRLSTGSWHPLGKGINGFVYSIVVDGNDLYFGGEFETAGDALAFNIARFNSQTSVWSGLTSGVGNRPGDAVYSIVIDGNDLYAGGYFDRVGEEDIHHIARWDKAGASWHSLTDEGTNGVQPDDNSVDRPVVYALELSGRTLYAGGRFDSVGGKRAYNLGAWDLEEKKWSAPNGPTGDITTYAVRALAAMDGALYIGRRDYPATAGRGTVPYLSRLDTTTGSWSEMAGGVDDSVLVLLPDNGSLLIGGAFGRAGTLSVNGIAQWNALTNQWSGIHADAGFAPNAPVNAIAISETGVFVGGRFTIVADTLMNHIAMFDGGTWSNLGEGINGEVMTIAIAGDNVYAGGEFSTAGGAAANNVAVWNTATKQWSALGTGVNGVVRSMAVSGNDLYIGGSFSSAGGSDADGIARWDGEAKTWSSLGMDDEQGVLGQVNAVAAIGDNIYVGGNLITAGSFDVSNIARWNTTSKKWFAMGDGIGGPVFAMAGKGDTLYAGGFFQSAGTIRATNIARWYPQTGKWDSVGNGVNEAVYAIATNSTEIYITGNFSASGSDSIHRVAISDGRSGWYPLGSGLGGDGAPEGRAIAADVYGIYVGGSFTHAGGKPSTYFAIYHTIVTSVPFESEEESIVLLGASHPNPFASSTSIPFLLRQSGQVTVSIFSADGTQVASPISGWLPAGSHTAVWDAAEIPAGVYLCVVRIGDTVKSLKLVLSH